MQRLFTYSFVILFTYLLSAQINPTKQPSNLLTETEPNNTTLQANPITYGDTVIASISPQLDIDYYSFYANADDTVEMYMNPRNGSQLSCRIWVYNSSGTFLSVGFYYYDTLANRFLMKMTASGTYYVKCSWFHNSATTIARNSNPIAENDKRETKYPHEINSEGDYSLYIRKFVPSAPGIYLPSAQNKNWNSAYLNAGVFPNGLSTTASFEYGLTPSYGNVIPAKQGTIPAGISVSNITTPQIYGLDGNTIYHMRVRAENAKGASYSADFTFTTPPQPDGWALVNNPFSSTIYGIHTFDISTAIAVSAAGKISKTTDGGNTWTVQNSGVTKNLTAITFVNSNSGYVVGESSAILKTTNGGTTWITLSSPSIYNLTFSSVAFTDANNGIITSSGNYIYRTTNGGTSWIPITNLPSASTINRVRIINSTTIFIVNNAGMIIRSTDGGATWTSQIIPDCITQMYDVAISGSGKLTAVGANNTIVTSTNNGDTWTRISGTQGPFLLSIAFINGTTGFITGTSGTLLKTTDEGNSWTSINSGTGNSLYFVSSADNCAYAVGSSGTVLKTTSFLTLTSPNGGENWMAREVKDITWQQAGVNNIKIEFSVNNGNTWNLVASPVPATNNSYQWRVPNTPTTQARIKITDVDLFGTLKMSNYAFTISARPPVPETEPNNSSTQSNSIAYGDSVTANISSAADVDYYSFTGTAGDTVDIKSFQRNGSNLYCYIKLYNNTGTVLESDNQYLDYNSAKVTYVLPTSGLYYIRFSNSSNYTPYPNKPQASTGDYCLVLNKFENAPPVTRSVTPNILFTNSVTFMALVYTNGYASTASFEYGLTTAYGNQAASTPVSFNSGFGAMIINSEKISGLTPNTLYHYRLKTENSIGISYSSDYTFTTPVSTDGWTRIDNNYSNLFTVKVLDQDNIFFGGVNPGGNGFRSTDRGNSWSASIGLNTQIGYSEFWNQTLGYSIGSAGKIYKTTDGGFNWSAVFDDPAYNLISISFIDQNNLVAIDLSNKVLKTTNGGTSWTLSVIPGTLIYAYHIKMVNNIGYLCGAYGLFMKTTDGGVTWNSMSINGLASTYLNNIYCFDQNNLIIIGSNGWISKSTNGGTSWTLINSETTLNLSSITFKDMNTGLITGDRGTILKTTDGGLTWGLQTSGCNVNLNCASYCNNTAFITGVYGSLLKNTNYVSLLTPAGGERWNTGATQNITWQHSGLTNVKLEFSTNNGSTWQVIVSSTSAATGSYPWIIPSMAKSALCKIRISDVQSQTTNAINTGNFTIFNLPGTPLLISPANYAADQIIPVNFSWHSAMFAEKYAFELSTDSTFITLILRDTVLTDTTKTVSTLSYNTKYYWRIMGKNSDGNGNWSEIRSFTTMTAQKSISGNINYYNTQGAPLKNVLVTLKSLQTGTVLTNTSDSLGRYSFVNLDDGKYLISATKFGGNGGYNSSDALLIMRFFTRADSLDLLQQCAADANNNGTINSSDALAIMQKYAEILRVFPGGKSEWVFKISNLASLRNFSLNTAIEGADTVNLTDQDLVINLKSLCTGDVNKSYSQASLSKENGIKIASTGVQKMQNAGLVEIPVKTGAIYDLGSFSLKINYPANIAKYEGIKFNNSIQGAVTNEQSGIISISWINPEPAKILSIENNSDLFTLLFKVEKPKREERIGITVDSEGEITDNKAEKIYPLLTANEIELSLPEEYILSQNYPNPFNPSTVIAYSIPFKSKVKLAVYNSLGQIVSELVNKEMEAGYYEASFSGTKSSSGVYLYSIEAAGSGNGKVFRSVKKMIFLK